MYGDGPRGIGACCWTGKEDDDCGGAYVFATDEGLSGCWYCDILVDGDDILGGGPTDPLGGGPSGGVALGGAPNEGPLVGCCIG